MRVVLSLSFSMASSSLPTPPGLLICCSYFKLVRYICVGDIGSSEAFEEPSPVNQLCASSYFFSLSAITEGLVFLSRLPVDGIMRVEALAEG
jgi:hypothetical protein